MKKISALALQRAAYADKYFPKLKAAVKAALSEITRTAAAMARAGKKLKWRDGEKISFKQKLFDAQRKLVFNMVSHGWRLAGEELQTGGRHFSGKSIPGDPVGIGEWSDFILRGDWKSLDKWLLTTSESASHTQMARLSKIWKNAAEAWITPESGAGKRGLTPLEIAAQIMTQGGVLDERRAQMLAATGSIWAYNEGALQRYTAGGVPVCEWLTADDDLRCPFCAEMNGRRVETGDAFWHSGDVFSVEDVGSLKIPTGKRGFDVRHPPLHPNCRCTILPIIDLRQRARIRAQ